MKKFLVTALVTLMLLSVCGCKKKQEEDPTPVEKDPIKVTITLNKEDINSDEMLVIEISKADFNYDDSPWVGIVKGDKNYEKEDDVDNDDIWYEYLTKENSTKFEVNIENYETGKYQVVVCSADGNDGYVCGSKVFNVTAVQESGNHDVNEYTVDWFNSKYGVPLYPFYIMVNGEETKYYDRKSGPLSDWSYSVLNTDGWHWYNGYLISADNKYAVGPEFESFSSFCTYEAKEYNGELPDEQTIEQLKYGSLYEVNPYTPLGIFGISIEADNGENQDWDSRSYSMIDMRKDFHCNDNLHIRLNVSSAYEDYDINNIAVYVFPNDMKTYEIVRLTDELKQQALITTGMNVDDNGKPFVDFQLWEAGEDEAGTGLYDIVFAFEDFVTYYVTIEVTRE